MGTSNYCVPKSNARNHLNDLKCAATPELENVTNVQGCEFYIAKRKR